MVWVNLISVKNITKNNGANQFSWAAGMATATWEKKGNTCCLKVEQIKCVA